MSVGPTVSVVVVSYNTREKLRRCLRRLEDCSEVIVVDNASADGSADMVRKDFPAVHLISNRENVGFGPANNQGSEVAIQPLILYLNSDAYAEPGSIRHLASIFQDSSIVAAGGQLLNPDGSLQVSSSNRLTLWAVLCEQFYLEKLFPNSRWLSPYWNTRRLTEEPEPAETEQVMGAALMVRAGFEKFDERFFLYCEDTDLCLRLRRRGRIVYVKSSRFIHELGSSSSGDPLVGVFRYNTGKETYFRIHHGVAASRFCAVLDRTGALLRSISWTVKLWLGGGEAAKRYRNGFWRIATGAMKPQR